MFEFPFLNMYSKILYFFPKSVPNLTGRVMRNTSKKIGMAQSLLLYTVDQVMFATINVCVFIKQTSSLLLMFADSCEEA